MSELEDEWSDDLILIWSRIFPFGVGGGGSGTESISSINLDFAWNSLVLCCAIALNVFEKLINFKLSTSRLTCLKGS